MSVETNHSILLVDDELSILKALQRLFRNHGFPVKTAQGGAEGLEALRTSEAPIALIISDQRMPEMNGAQFLERAKSLAPEAMRFLLTGHSDLEAVVEAVNKGEIHRFMHKPWNDAELLVCVRQAVEHYCLVQENRRLAELTRRQNQELNEFNRGLEQKVDERTREIQRQNAELESLCRGLEQSFKDTVRLMSSLVESLNPRLGELMREVARLSRDIAGDVGLPADEVDQIEIAALIHDIGFLGMPDRIWEKEEKDLTEGELQQFLKHPVIASICMEPVERLARAAEIVLHHHEHADGSGFPSGLTVAQIPIGSRILLAAADVVRVLAMAKGGKSQILQMARQTPGALNGAFLKLEPDQMAVELAQKTLLGGKHRYDPVVVAALVNRLEHRKANQGTGADKTVIQAVEIGRLREGMFLATDLKINDGKLLLLAGGSRLNPASIAIIRKMVSHGLLEDRVWVTAPAGGSRGGS
jgi:response regulator RpfG family c-di-GMP phosphodiesterase